MVLKKSAGCDSLPQFGARFALPRARHGTTDVLPALEVWLRGSKLGEVFAATERAACLRATSGSGSAGGQQELEVRRAKDAEAGAMHSRF